MKKRTRKPPVEPAVAREWLRRHQEAGESVAEIARTAGFDVRTVKKQLERMHREREAREARQLVLKGVLERHYADLCSFAEKMRADVKSYPPSSVSPLQRNDPLWPALRQHLSRTPIWRDVDKLDRLIPDYEAAARSLRTRVEKEAVSLTSLPPSPSGDQPGILPGFSQVVAYQLEIGVRGWRGFTGVPFATKESDLGTMVRLGQYSIALLAKRDSDAKQAEVKKACDRLMKEGVQWEEHATLAKVVRDLMKVEKDLNDGLTTVILRRLLPGRCVYCPY